MPRDFWLNQRAALPVKKINKHIVLDAFSADCREVNKSLYINADDEATAFHSAPSMADFVNLVSIEAWIKVQQLPAAGSTGRIFGRYNLTGGIAQYEMWITSTGLLAARFRKGGAYTTVTSTIPVPIYEWCFPAVHWNGTNVNLSLNQDIISADVALAANIDAIGAGTVKHRIGLSELTAVDIFNGWIDEVRLWNSNRSPKKGTGVFIKDYHIACPRNVVAADSVDDSLKAYYKFNGTNVTNGDTESISGQAVTSGGIVDTDGFPLRYGASFIAKLYTVTNTAKCSLKFPVVVENANHGLCVSWHDDANVLQRRKLYNSDSDLYDGIKINPNPDDYNGEKLPETFYLEFWNVDGNLSVDLEEDLTIYLSITSDPTHSRDHTSLEESTPNGTTTLADPYPVAFLASTTQTY